MKRLAWLALAIAAAPAVAQSNFGQQAPTDPARTSIARTADPITGDTLFDTDDRDGAEETGTCTGVWASWRGTRHNGRSQVFLELVIRWGADVAEVPVALDSLALLGRTGNVSEVPISWKGEPRYVPGTEYTAPQWRQSLALDPPEGLLALLEHGPVVIGVSGRSAQANYTCRAKLPDEIPGDLTTLRTMLR